MLKKLSLRSLELRSNLTQLRKNKRSKPDKKSGRKKPRIGDTELSLQNQTISQQQQNEIPGLDAEDGKSNLDLLWHLIQEDEALKEKKGKRKSEKSKFEKTLKSTVKYMKRKIPVNAKLNIKYFIESDSESDDSSPELKSSNTRLPPTSINIEDDSLKSSPNDSTLLPDLLNDPLIDPNDLLQNPFEDPFSNTETFKFKEEFFEVVVPSYSEKKSE